MNPLEKIISKIPDPFAGERLVGNKPWVETPVPEYPAGFKGHNGLRLALLGAAALGALVLLASCSDADVASHNLSKAADNFEVQRRVIFYNGITDKYILTIEGRCSMGNFDNNRELTVTCKTGPGEFKKHFLGLSDNVTYFAEQLDPVAVGVYHYRVFFKPAAIIPDVDLKLGDPQ